MWQWDHEGGRINESTRRDECYVINEWCVMKAAQGMISGELWLYNYEFLSDLNGEW